ncbi:hypothetical protein PHLGIDRAFT_300022 [Phlebiopsis gigantea 11061_1 CR5-6]|uniref:Uncharacterized protein n=1 Tax=Phlebiopsis gigantea (strain 11061_1 CR5-6) TaxID=745531 RepID=A0A0C3S390_PHLG1|nr:hypothetical protein PHLGIDRAFT_300022 [Phlebiopsis gigantea 11061_1 CR5-6]
MQAAFDAAHYAATDHHDPQDAFDDTGRVPLDDEEGMFEARAREDVSSLAQPALAPPVVSVNLSGRARLQSVNHSRLPQGTGVLPPRQSNSQASVSNGPHIHDSAPTSNTRAGHREPVDVTVLKMTRKNLGLQMLTHSATQSRMSTMMRHDRARSLDTRLPDWVKSPIRSREGSLASPSLSCAPTSLPGRAFQTLRHQQRYTACAARRMRGHSTSCWRLTLSLLRDTTQFRLVTLLPCSKIVLRRHVARSKILSASTSPASSAFAHVPKTTQPR